jgi:hypothetical protein
LALFVLWPRTIDELPAAAPASGTITNAAAKAARDILYTDGYHVLLGNFVMLIPIALLLWKIFPTINAQSILLICLSTTISIEFLQKGNIKEAFRILLHYYDKLYQKALDQRENLKEKLHVMESDKVDSEFNAQLIINNMLYLNLIHFQ